MKSQFILIATAGGFFVILWLRNVAWGIFYANPGEFLKHLGSSLLFGRDRSLFRLRQKYERGRGMQVRGLIFHRRLTLVLFAVGIYLAAAFMRWSDIYNQIQWTVTAGFFCMIFSFIAWGPQLPKVFEKFDRNARRNYHDHWMPTSVGVSWSGLAVGSFIQIVTQSVTWAAVILCVATGIVSIILIAYLSRREGRRYDGRMTKALIWTFVLSAVLFVGLGRLFPPTP